jgi:hypothetical protein
MFVDEQEKREAGEDSVDEQRVLLSHSRSLG